MFPVMALSQPAKCWFDHQRRSTPRSRERVRLASSRRPCPRLFPAFPATVRLQRAINSLLQPAGRLQAWRQQWAPCCCSCCWRQRPRAWRPPVQTFQSILKRRAGAGRLAEGEGLTGHSSMWRPRPARPRRDPSLRQLTQSHCPGAAAGRHCRPPLVVGREAEERPPHGGPRGLLRPPEPLGFLPRCVAAAGRQQAAPIASAGPPPAHPPPHPPPRPPCTAAPLTTALAVSAAQTRAPAASASTAAREWGPTPSAARHTPCGTRCAVQPQPPGGAGEAPARRRRLALLLAPGRPASRQATLWLDLVGAAWGNASGTAVPLALPAPAAGPCPLHFRLPPEHRLPPLPTTPALTLSSQPHVPPSAGPADLQLVVQCGL